MRTIAIQDPLYCSGKRWRQLSSGRVFISVSCSHGSEARTEAEGRKINVNIPAEPKFQATPIPPASFSFRDPAGTLLSVGGRIIRIVNQTGEADWSSFLASRVGQELLEEGLVVHTQALVPHQSAELLANPTVLQIFNCVQGRLILEHERIPFPSFPYEWPAEMLHQAGVLTLDLAQRLLDEGLGLKDGTPYNVLFRGADPVFVDVLSFEKRTADDPLWLPYAQFIRCFLLPLLASKFFFIQPDQLLLGRRDGLEPEELYRWASALQKLRPPFLGLVSIPTWLAAAHDQDDTKIYHKKSVGDPDKARYILKSLFGRLRRKLDSLAPVKGKISTWSNYMSSKNYSQDQFLAKESFVQQALSEFKPKRVLDAGCNTGRFSEIAARSGSSVVAIDYDPIVVGEVWRKARSERLDILPLVVNLTRPTPGIGWRNRECSSFLDRARGYFDAVMMLAVIHHMLVTERIPLTDILELASELTSDLLVIEFIGPQDSMFRRITRGRENLHNGLTVKLFEETARRYFEVVRSSQLEGSSRWMYLLRKKR